MWCWFYRELDEGKGCLQVAKDDRVGTQALGKKGQHGARHLRAACQRLVRTNTRQIQEALGSGYPECHSVQNDIHVHQKQWPGNR